MLPALRRLKLAFWVPLDPHSAMQEAALSLLCILAGLPALDANDPEDKNSPFYYDWHSLRVGGLICAGLLCALGIIVLLSGKCKCKFRQKPSPGTGDAPPLITPGKTAWC
ncbi:FXYD domain-containing ion transport regulator 3 isoform 2-T2 [Thomomys bottae]